jgi:hypothetical protein
LHVGYEPEKAMLKHFTWPRGRGAVMPRKSARVRPARDVIAAESEGTCVLLDLRRDIYFGLDEVGTLVWREIEAGGTAAGAAQRICAEFDATEDVARRDAEQFIAELSARGLVVHA